MNLNEKKISNFIKFKMASNLENINLEFNRLFIDETHKYKLDDNKPEIPFFNRKFQKQQNWFELSPIVENKGCYHEAESSHLVDKHEEKSNSKLEKQNPKFDKLFKEKDIQIINQTSEQSRLKCFNLFMKIKHERLDLEIARVRNLLNERNTACAQHLIDLENQISILKPKSVIREKRFSKATSSSSSLSSQTKVKAEEEEEEDLLYHIKNGNRIANNEKSSKKSSLISISRTIAGKFIKAKKPSAECIPMVPDKRVFTKRFERMNNINSSKTKQIPVLNRNKTYLVANEKTTTKTKQPAASAAVSSSSSLVEFKNQKRAEINKIKVSQTSPLKSDVAISNKRSLETIILKGRQNGNINLSDFGLCELPPALWNINTNDKQKESDLSMDNSADFRWWEQVELTKLILATNKLTQITKDIKHLSHLTSLDIHDNQLQSIDDAVGELNLLQNLNLSHNQLTTLPNNICELRRLTHFNLSHNKLTSLPKNIGQIDDLEDFDLSENCLTQIPKSFGWFRKLRCLNLKKNSFKTLLPEIFNSTPLKIIDVSENQLEELPNELGELTNIEQLYARQNRIKKLPYLIKSCKLKDWDMSFNKISEINENSFDNLVSLVNFNLRDNQLISLPSTIKNLQVLERLDVSNNNLSSLPCELAMIESLKQLLLVGNPLRTIRKDIMSRGSDAIIKHLRNHLTQENLNSSTSQDLEENMLRSDIIKSTKIFDLSGKKLTSITTNMISFCKQSTALVLNLSKNSLQDLPEEIEQLAQQLNELNLSVNSFTMIPKPVMKLTNLVSLDLRGNHFKEITIEINKLKSLRELIIADNQLTEIPLGVYELPILENLFLNNNHIKSIDPFKINAMKFLTTLNLQNNDLLTIPIELGKAEHLKSLQLEGNPFRVPRPQILAKGTPAILEYLRGRIAES